MNIEALICNSTVAAVKELYGQEISTQLLQLQKTKSNFEGNLTLVVFPLLKISRKKPEETAQDIGKYLQTNSPAVESFNVVKGFLNLIVSPAAWFGLLNDIDSNPTFGMRQATYESPLAMIEYSSPNTNKPLHLGHVRNNLLGWSLAKIMEANGWKVVKTNIVNDRGIHICKSMLAWLLWGKGETPDMLDIKGDHYVGNLYVQYNNKLKKQERIFRNYWDKQIAPANLKLEKNLYDILIERYKYHNSRNKNKVNWYLCLLYQNIIEYVYKKKYSEELIVTIDLNNYKKALSYVSKKINKKRHNKEYRFDEDYAYGMYKILFDFLSIFISSNKFRQSFENIAIITLIENRITKQINNSLLYKAQQLLVKWEQNDPEVRALWEKMNNWVYDGFDKTYKALGVSFDKIYYESNTYLKGKKKVEEGLEKGLFFRKEDNSVWADLTDEGLDQKLLLRSDGTSVYMTQDIGTADMRFKDYPIDKMIYVVGNEQNYHFQVLSILLDRLGFKWGKELVHFSYGMVELPNGKMKSREGTVVDADDLIETMIANAKQLSDDKVNKIEGISEEEKNEIARIVGLGALKYFILKVDARKNMLFNPEESIDFNGNTGPFIQYTHARIRSILRKNEELRMKNEESANCPDSQAKDSSLEEKEIELIQKMTEFEAVVEQAGKDYSPSGIANYCYELTKQFNQFYHDYSILGAETEEKKQLRLMLARNVAKVLKNGMALLGIEVPERM